MSKWSNHDDLIREAVRKDPKASYSHIAREILGITETSYNYDVDTLRTHITRLIQKDSNVPAKVLLFDIETAPMKGYFWSKWEPRISDDDIIDDWFILCWSAKWLFGKEVFGMKLNKKELKAHNDKRITEGLWKAIDDADIIIAHNLKKFDRKKANSRFLMHGMYPPSPYKSIDTLLVARSQLSETSNRLDYLAKRLGIEGKMETPKGLWRICVEGNMDAMNTMKDYCDQDVRVLEDVYLRLRPYVPAHPNMGLYVVGSDTNICPSCGSDDLRVVGEYHTTVNTYEAYRCGCCGSLTRARKALTSIKSNKYITSSLP